MSAVLVYTADMTDSADAFKRGYVNAPNTIGPELTDPAMASQSQAVDPPVFPRDPVSAGFKLVLDRIMRFGGNMGMPGGPGKYTPRMRARTGIAERPGPAVIARNLDPRTPAGLVPVDPTYESYLTQDGYL